MSDSETPGTTPARLLCPRGFSRQEYCSGLPCAPPGDLPNPGIKPRSPLLQVDYLLCEPPGKPTKETDSLATFIHTPAPCFGHCWGLILLLCVPGPSWPPSPPLSDSLLSWGGSQWWQISCSFFTWSIHPTRAVSQKVNLIRRAVKKEVLRHRGWNLKLIFQSWVSDGQARRSRKSQFEIFTGNSWHKDLDPFQSSQAFASLLSYESKKSWLLPKVWSFQLISKTVKKILIAA